MFISLRHQFLEPFKTHLRLVLDE